jgi:hypothetical protein
VLLHLQRDKQAHLKLKLLKPTKEYKTALLTKMGLVYFALKTELNSSNE